MGFIGTYGGASVTVDVTGGVSISPVPATEIAPQTKFFLNGSAYNQNVDGSSTPQLFTIAPPAGEIWYCEHITFGLDDGGGCPPTSYGAITSGLTNGVKVDLIKDSSTYEIVNLKNNGDVSLAFNFAVGTFENGKYMALANGFLAKMVFATNLGLDGDTSDKLQITIRDDLTGLTFQRASGQIWKRIT